MIPLSLRTKQANRISRSVPVRLLTSPRVCGDSLLTTIYESEERDGSVSGCAYIDAGESEFSGDSGSVLLRQSSDVCSVDKYASDTHRAGRFSTAVISTGSESSSGNVERGCSNGYGCISNIPSRLPNDGERECGRLTQDMKSSEHLLSIDKGDLQHLGALHKEALRSNYETYTLLTCGSLIVAFTFAMFQYRAVPIMTHPAIPLFQQTIIALVISVLALISHYVRIPALTGAVATKQHASMIVLTVMLVFSFVRDYWYAQSENSRPRVDNPDGVFLPKSMQGFSKAVTAVSYACLTARFVPLLDVFVMNIWFISISTVLFLCLVSLPSLIRIAVGPKEVDSYMHNYTGALTIAMLLREYVKTRVDMLNGEAVLPAMVEIAEAVAEVMPIVSEARKCSVMSGRNNYSDQEFERKMSVASLKVQDACRTLHNVSRRGDMAALTSDEDNFYVS